MVKNKVHKKKEAGFLNLEHPTFKIPKTIGQKAADILTTGAGSWIFIILFLVFLVLWMATGGLLVLKYLNGDLTDPYPFILLNLVLSCLAAIQAPIILMSQNRQTEIDRVRAQYDYAVNRKAEREIQELRKQLNRIENRFIKKK